MGENEGLVTNDAKVMVSFIKKYVFNQYRRLRVVISDGRTHFYN